MNQIASRKNENEHVPMFSVVDKNDNTVIFINGCFWHHHENCRMAVIPKTRTDFWIDKFERNRANDARNTEILKSMGWISLQYGNVRSVMILRKQCQKS